MEIEALIINHKDIFGEEPELIIHAPGRVNLIGEHTDYSDGFVMPMAINRGITLAISRIPDSAVISVYSVDYDKKMTSMFSDLMKSSVDWFNYPVGVVKVLQKEGHKFDGVRITFTGDVPQGAGLSSSAALEIGVAFGIQKLYNLKIEGPKLAQICRQAEHEVVGVKCGIMDQYISRMGEEGKALLIDCRTLEYRAVPLPLGSVKIIITNSKVPHKLSSSLYNTRVMECEEAVKILSITKEGTALRDFTKEDFDKIRDSLPAEVRKRAHHVISENSRVLEAEKALLASDLKKFGQLMNESHESLKTFYEVSSPELDFLVEAAQSIPGCYGSRLTGAGFGGCTVSLIEEASIAPYREKLKEYTAKFKYEPEIYETAAMPGVHVKWNKS